MNFYGELPDSYNLVVNANHPLVSKVISETEAKMKADLEKVNGEIAPVEASLKELQNAQKDLKHDCAVYPLPFDIIKVHFVFWAEMVFFVAKPRNKLSMIIREYVDFLFMESAVQTTPPITRAATIPEVPVSPTATIISDAKISVIRVIPETGLVPTMAMAFAATVVKRNAIMATTNRPTTA